MQINCTTIRAMMWGRRVFAKSGTKARIGFEVSIICGAYWRLCFRWIDSTVPLLLKPEFSGLWLHYVAVQPGLCQTWSEVPKTGLLTAGSYGSDCFMLLSINALMVNIFLNYKNQYTCTFMIHIQTSSDWNFILSEYCSYKNQCCFEI